MSDPTYYTRLTDIGSAALNNAITGGDSVALTELALGDANGASYDPDGSETTLANEQYRLAISSITPDAQNPAWLIVEAVIPPDVGGWWIREAGIFDANGAMFAIAKYPETYKAVLSDGTASTLTIQIVLQVTNTDSIELVVNPLDGYATQGWVVSAFPWATEAEAVNALIENKLVDPKRLAYVLSQLDMASSEDLNSLSQTLDQDLSGKADVDHNHDDRYYTKSISDGRFLGKTATAANATKLGGQLASYFASATGLSSGYYDKATSDGRFLGKTAKAADSDKLDGQHASYFASATGLSSGYYDKATSDGRFLGKTAKAADSDKLDGKHASDFSLMSEYTSAQQTITSGGLLTLAHGLGATPKLVSGYLVCKVAEEGYSVGDIVPMNPNTFSGGGTFSNGYVVVVDSSKLYVRFCAGAAVFHPLNYSSGSARTITNANWRLVLQAWR
nr:phage tail protein [uncultured Cohaesibacter sp.]